MISEELERLLSFIDDMINDILNNENDIRDTITILNNRNIRLDKNLFMKHPSLLRLTNYILSKLSEDPKLIKEIPFEKLTEEQKRQYTRSSVENGFRAEVDDFINNPELVNYIDTRTIERLLSTDPRMILIVAPLLSGDQVEYYDKRVNNTGFVATYENIINYPILLAGSNIVETAVEHDPNVIKLITSNIDVFIANEALEKVELTREDFEKNPALRRLYCITGESSKYRIYSTDLSNEEKIVYIKDLLQQGRIDEVSELPFLKYDLEEGIDIDTIIDFISLIIPEMIDDDIHQEAYWPIFGRMIDGVVFSRYSKEKKLFVYSSIDQLVNDMEKSFKLYSAGKKDSLDILKLKLTEFASGGFLDKLYAKDKGIEEKVSTLIGGANFNDDEERIYDIIKGSIPIFYLLYLQNGHLPNAEEDKKHNYGLGVFCNYILNEHRNSYQKMKKKHYQRQMLLDLPLREKKREEIIRYKKRRKLVELIKGGLNSPLLDKKLHQTRENLKHGKFFRQKQVILSDELIDEFERVFRTNGRITKEEVDEIISARVNYVISDDILKQIVKGYDKIHTDLQEKIPLTKEEEQEITPEERAKYGQDISCSNFSMINPDKTYEVLAYLLLEISSDKERFDKATANILSIDEIRNIVPFFGILSRVEELSKETLLNIITYYERTKERILEKVTKDTPEEAILTIFDKFINIANGYASSNDLSRIVLQGRTPERVPDYKLDKYAELYAEGMFDRYESHIPIVSGKSTKYTFESDFKDEDRLLMGYMYNDSCIGLDAAGEEIFKMCLIGMDGDVVLVRDKVQGELITRAIVVRAGNVIQIHMRGFNGEVGGSNNPEYKEIIDKIGNSILEQAIISNDDVVVVVSEEHGPFQDDRLKEKFPHADWSGRYRVIGYNVTEPPTESMHFDVAAQAVYYKPRKQTNEDVSEYDVMRLQALKILRTEDKVLRARLTQEFTPVDMDDYEYTFMGEDWFVGQRKDGKVDEIIVPVRVSKVQRLEIEEAKKEIDRRESKGSTYG